MRIKTFLYLFEVLNLYTGPFSMFSDHFYLSDGCFEKLSLAAMKVFLDLK